MKNLKECPRCLMTEDIAKIPDNGGQCEYCDLHDTLESQSSQSRLLSTLHKIRKAGTGKRYDCLIGVSGGYDSSRLMMLAVKEWNLRPLAMHFDNGFNETWADDNINKLCQKLGVDLIICRPQDTHEYLLAVKSMLAASTPDADIVNDMVMTKLMYESAEKFKIKYILNGHDFRTEGSTPRAWTYMDDKYIKDAFRQFTGREINTVPLANMWDQISYGLIGIKQYRPFHDIIPSKADHDKLIKLGWQPYEAKHGENFFTAYVGYHLLPTKFGIDKRRVYLSAMMRSGYITRAEAMKRLDENVSVSYFQWISKVKYIINSVNILAPVRDRMEFDRNNFKKWRILILLMVKIGALPYTFYAKYCR